MSLQDQINHDIKNAMLNKEVAKLTTLRLVKSAFILELSKDGSKSISDDIAQKIISKLAKQRREAYSIFIQQGRDDLAKEEQQQLRYLTSYLPEQMNEDNIKKIIQDVIVQTSSTSLSDTGKCMGLLMKKIGGKADGKLVASLLKEALSGID